MCSTENNVISYNKDSAVMGKCTGNFETTHPMGKYRLKCLTWFHLDNVKIIDHKSFHINPRTTLANVIFRDFHWTM
jgi:hypothetical protein